MLKELGQRAINNRLDKYIKDFYGDEKDLEYRPVENPRERKFALPDKIVTLTADDFGKITEKERKRKIPSSKSKDIVPKPEKKEAIAPKIKRPKAPSKVKLTSVKDKNKQTNEKPNRGRPKKMIDNQASLSLEPEEKTTQPVTPKVSKRGRHSKNVITEKNEPVIIETQEVKHTGKVIKDLQSEIKEKEKTELIAVSHKHHRKFTPKEGQKVYNLYSGGEYIVISADESEVRVKETSTQRTFLIALADMAATR